MALKDWLWEPSPKELGILFSYHYYSATDLTEYVKGFGYTPTVFVDSGGFSAASLGAPIDLKDYVGWLKKHRDIITVYANLDIIGDPKETLRNHLRMQSQGLRPLPVVHFGTDPNELLRYRDRGYEYQCLGGLVPHMKEASASLRSGDEKRIRESPVLSWLDKCHQTADKASIGLHGFGVTTWGVMLRYPWKSVDSSSWSSGFRFGNIQFFNPDKASWHGVQMKDSNSIMPHAHILRGYGCNPVSLIRDDSQSRANGITLAARSYLVAQRWMQKNKNIEDMKIILAGGSYCYENINFLAGTMKDTKVYLAASPAPGTSSRDTTHAAATIKGIA